MWDPPGDAILGCRGIITGVDGRNGKVFRIIGANISDESSFFVSVELCIVLESGDTGSDGFSPCL